MHVHVCVYTVHDIHVCTVHAQYILMYMHIMNSVALHIYMMSIPLFLKNPMLASVEYHSGAVQHGKLLNETLHNSL